MTKARDEILQQLGAHPAGLTTKELAERCAAAEHDPQIVARLIAQLRQEKGIHAGAELREGGAIWVLGAPKEAGPVERITLPDAPAGRQGPSASEAARAIADMRRPIGTAKPATKTTEPAAQEPAPPPGDDMKPKTSVADRVLEALGKTKEGENLDMAQLVNRTQASKAALYTALSVLKKQGRVHSPQYGCYALGKKPKASAPESTPARTPRSAKRAHKHLAKKGRGGRAGRRQASRNGSERAAARSAPAPQHKNGAAAYAINEYGELGIEHAGQKMHLDVAAFERLREFIDKTKPIWG